MNTPAPKCFMSYSWTTKQHATRVLELSTDLVENGVDVVLDKWDLREGHDANHFMETMVSDEAIRKVILVCDHEYVRKANERTGGVGTETQIISPEVYRKSRQDKFVAVVFEKNPEGKPFLPAYYSSRIYIDLSTPTSHAENFEQLMRWIFDKPLYKKPQLGKMPEYLKEDAIALGTTSKARRATESVRGALANWRGHVAEYFSAVSENLERFRLDADDCNRLEQSANTDRTSKNVETFLPYRNEAIGLISTMAMHLEDGQSSELLHRFFEDLLPFLDSSQTVASHLDTDFDNYRFIVHELFLYTIAILLGRQRFTDVCTLLQTQYYVPNLRVDSWNGMVSFEYMYQPIGFVAKAVENHLASSLHPHSDLLEKRSHESAVEFPKLMQADFVLYLRGELDRLPENRHWPRWYPVTLDGSSTTAGNMVFEVFARSQSTRYFNQILKILGIQSKEELDALMHRYAERSFRFRNWHSPAQMMGYEFIATRD
ncbi:SEFIR domain-containing protein [Aureliella helgolandensis]|uniref:SEFIR domain protein n=1 Tax=Aureliella helgolandensis TaxID=2527968 RepID=A0A518G4C4_9BACT|nr:SEFIR domain-containing protein [Aureliella helgolandensis]QDV23448.1 SEFIR domain protein [Aureliella helgolandensis]